MKFFRKIADKTAGALLLLAVALAALKFGTVAAVPEMPVIFPENLTGFLLTGLPQSVFGIVSAVVLLLEVLATKRVSFDGKSGKIALLFGFAIPLAAFLGAVASPLGWIVRDYLGYFFSCGAFAVATKFYIGNDEKKVRFLFAATGVAALLVSVAAIEQYFFGFARMRAFIASEMARGVSFSAPMLAKIADDRVFATMTNANVLAGFLLLTSPLGVVGAAKFGEKIFSDARSGKICAGFAAFLFGAVFLLTKTRGAFLAALLTFALAVWLAPLKKTLKIAATALLVAAICAGACYIKICGRGFSSAAERMSYLETSCRITAHSPLTGGGWGSFFLDHMKYKTTSTDETPRDPHNVIVSFLAQCGAAGALAVISAMLLTLVFLRRMKNLDAWHGALFFGSAAFLLHSMVELNHLVPASWGLFGILAVAGTTSQKEIPPTGKMIFFNFLFAFILGLCTLTLSLQLLRRDYTYSRYCEVVARQNLQEEKTWRCAAFAAATDAPFIREKAGDAAWRRHDVAAAESFWREAWRLSPTRPSLCRRLAAVAALRGDQEEVQMWQLKARELFPGDPKR